MIAAVLALSLSVGAADMDACTDKIADAMNSQSCKGLGPTLFIGEAEAFLAGQASLLGAIFEMLDREGKLSVVIDHIGRSRAYWRKGKPTPRAAGH